MNLSPRPSVDGRRARRPLAIVLALGLMAAFLAVTSMPSQADETAATQTYTSPTEPSLTYTVPTSIEVGQDIVVSGTGWQDRDATEGSVIAVLLDATGSGDPNTVITKREVINPVTGGPALDDRWHAVVKAEADGQWTATIPFPTPENSSAGDTTRAWVAGGTHQIRFLTGTLQTSDPIRSLAADFTIGEVSEPGAGDPPPWSHHTVAYTDPASGDVATAWISRDVGEGEGAAIRVKGAGWTTAAGTGGSTVALKLNNGPSQQYTRSGGDIVAHPSAAGDDTIWVLLAPENPQNHPHVYEVADDGTFDIEIDAPADLIAGQYLTALFQSGRFDDGDVQRTVTSDFLVVGGVPYVDDGGEAQQTCVPSSVSPEVTIENPTVSLGGQLRVTGTGWCHPGEERGGSVIALKIDEGAYSHLPANAVHQNRTIWMIVEADEATGDFDVELPLPDGTTAGPRGSDPALPEGAHTLRLLTGSLKTGDTPRSVQSGEFVVGDYRPNRTPLPLEATEDLPDSVRGGVGVERTASALRVTIPGTQPGDWVFLTAYGADGSPRYPWADTWFRAGAGGVVLAPLSGAALPVGVSKLVAQSGNEGDMDRLLGWVPLVVAAVPPPPPAPAPAAPASPAPAAPVPVLAAASPASPAAPVVEDESTAPDEVPEPPFADGSGLTPENAGDVQAVQDGTIVTLTLPTTEPGDWVYLYAYSTPIPVGWVQVDAERQVRVDVANLSAGEHKIAVLGRDGNLIGWSGVTVDGDEDASSESDADRDADSSPVTIAAAGGDGGGLSAADWWLIGIGMGLAAGAAIIVALKRRRTAVNEGSPTS